MYMYEQYIRCVNVSARGCTHMYVFVDILHHFTAPKLCKFELTLAHLS